MELSGERTVLVIASVFLSIGAALLLHEWNPAWPSDLGWTLFGLGLSTLLTYFVIDALLLRDERNKWREIQDKAHQLIGFEVFGVFNNMRLVAGLTTAVTNSMSTTLDEEFAEIRRAELTTTKRLSTNLDELRTEIDPKLFQGSYGTIFEYRADRLDRLESKYSKHLKPEELAVIIELQESLRRLDTNIALILKYRKDGTRLSQAFAKEQEDSAIRMVQRVLRILVEANEAGLLPLT